MNTRIVEILKDGKFIPYEFIKIRIGSKFRMFEDIDKTKLVLDKKGNSVFEAIENPCIKNNIQQVTIADTI